MFSSQLFRAQLVDRRCCTLRALLCMFLVRQEPSCQTFECFEDRWLCSRCCVVRPGASVTQRCCFFSLSLRRTSGSAPALVERPVAGGSEVTDSVRRLLNDRFSLVAVVRPEARCWRGCACDASPRPGAQFSFGELKGSMVGACYLFKPKS